MRMNNLLLLIGCSYNWYPGGYEDNEVTIINNYNVTENVNNEWNVYDDVEYDDGGGFDF